MHFLSFVLLVGSFALYPFIRKIIVKGVWTMILSTAIRITLAILLIIVICVSLGEILGFKVF